MTIDTNKSRQRDYNLVQNKPFVNEDGTYRLNRLRSTEVHLECNLNKLGLLYQM